MSTPGTPTRSGRGPAMGVSVGSSPAHSLPDMSYLTAEERAIIKGVTQRHQSEENRDVSFLR